MNKEDMIYELEELKLEIKRQRNQILELDGALARTQYNINLLIRELENEK